MMAEMDFLNMLDCRDHPVLMTRYSGESGEWKEMGNSLVFSSNKKKNIIYPKKFNYNII